MVKLAKYKDKERILKPSRSKQALTYKGRHIRVVADLSTETWQARREWQEIFSVLNRKNMQPRILYPARIEGEYNTRRHKGFRKQTLKEFIPTKQKLKEFITIKPALQEI